MFLVITADPATAIAARLLPLRAFPNAFLITKPTASSSPILCSTTALAGKGSEA